MGAHRTGSVQLNPPDVRLGDLEQRQRYAEGDTLADFLQAGEVAMKTAAAARVPQLATALATADGAEHPVPGSQNEILRRSAPQNDRLRTTSRSRVTLAVMRSCIQPIKCGSPGATRSGR